jgi:hypothetical protein
MYECRIYCFMCTTNVAADVFQRVYSAGANTAYELCYHASTAVLVDVPSGTDRQALVANSAA